MRNAVEDLRHYKLCVRERAALLSRSVECDSSQASANRMISVLMVALDNRQDLIRDLDTVRQMQSDIIRNDRLILKSTIRKKNRERWGWGGGGVVVGILIGLIPKFVSLIK